MSMKDIVSESETWEQLCAFLASLVDLEGLAGRTGALRRRRCVRDLTGLLRLALAYANGPGSLRATAAWAAQAGIATLSDVALLKRLRGAADWLMAVALAGLSRLSPAVPVTGGRRLRLVDASCISMPGSKGTDWRLHAVFDPSRQGFVDLELTDSTGGERLDRFAVTPGEIWIGDRCYATAAGFRHVLDGAADFLVRIGWNALRLRRPDGSAFDLFAALRRTDQVLDCPVAVEDRARKATIPDLRLLAWRKAPDAVAKERLRIRQDAKRKGKQPDPRSLEAAEWVILVTSLDSAGFPPDIVFALYRLRWQIELAFKKLKSLAHLDDLPARTPALARAWIAAKIITAVLIGQTIQEFLESPPCGHRNRQPAPVLLAPLPARL